jgi:Fic family protein
MKLWRVWEIRIKIFNFLIQSIIFFILLNLINKTTWIIMALELIFQKIENLKKELEPLRPLKKEQLRRLEQKLRLDWNYHSNHIEGNTLTYGETKALILHGITANNKPISDHLEVSGHNEAVELLMGIVRKEEEYDITEMHIRQIHQLIIPEESFTEAVTDDGKKIRKKFTPGKYKTQPNNVITSTGEIKEFTSPEDTPAEMQKLFEWYKKEKDQDQDPIILATAFHYQFVRIHPFDDGNGRMARILMNLIIMQGGYPPAIIPTERKTEYLNALEHADKADDLDQFTELVAESVAASLELELKAARGESIEEPDDIDKKVALLEKRIEWGGMDTELKEIKNKKNLNFLFNNSLKLLSESVYNNLIKMSNIIRINQVYYSSKVFKGKNANSNFVIHHVNHQINQNDYFLDNINNFESTILHINYFSSLLGQNEKRKKTIETIFTREYYEVRSLSSNLTIRRRYHQQLTEDEIEMIAREVFDSVYSEIEQLLKENEQKKSPDSRESED